MKIIDILNKIARGEEPPKKILYREEVLTYNQYQNDYYDADGDRLFEEYDFKNNLNDEVEILEITITNKQKKIEKLDFDRNDITYCDGNLRTDVDMVDIIIEIKNKINEIIDHIQE